MSVLDRSALEASPLADLHALASELSIDGYRRLRKAELIDAILVRQGGEADAGEEPLVLIGFDGRLLAGVGLAALADQDGVDQLGLA